MGEAVDSSASDDEVKAPAEWEMDPDFDPEPLPPAVCALNAPPPKPIRWAVRGLIPAGELGLIGSDGGVGKTTLALHIAGAIAGGYCVADHPRFKAEAGPVLIVSEEDPAPVLLNRLGALAAGHRWKRDQVFKNIHFFALAGVNLTDPRWQLHLLATVERIQPASIIFDPLFELTDRNEDSNTDQRPTVQFCRLLCRRSGAAVIIVMHFGKAAEGKRKIDRLRGASAWYNAARFALVLEERKEGVLVECLKMSRAMKPTPFVLEREVTADPANEGTWQSASLRHRTPHAVELERAEEWVLVKLMAAGARLSTTDLKRAAHGSGISAADVSGAIKRLQNAQRIGFERGPNRTHLWSVLQSDTHLPGTLGNPPGEHLPDLPNTCRASPEPSAGGCPPLKGGGNLAGSGGSRQPPLPATPHVWSGVVPGTVATGAIVRLVALNGRWRVESLDGGLVLAECRGPIDDPAVRQRLLEQLTPAARRDDLERILARLPRFGVERAS